MLEYNTDSTPENSQGTSH